MIRYTLRCERGHTFESWFQSSSSYDAQVKRKLVDLRALRLGECREGDHGAKDRRLQAPLAETRSRSRIYDRRASRARRFGMIRYNLRCDGGHTFESWFQSSSAYDLQVKRKLVTCAICGSAKVEKAIMAPRIAGTKKRGSAAPADSSTSATMAEGRELRAELKQLHDHLVKNADNVGARFPNEARKMHYGDIEHRPIYGEASPEEARSLIEEGVEVGSLPVLRDDRN